MTRKKLRVPPCWALSDHKDILPSRMTLIDFMNVLEKSLDWDKATEEELEETDTEETIIFFLRISKSISGSLSGMDDQIVKLQNGLRRLSMETCKEAPPVRKLLESIFNLTKGTNFYKIHNTVISSVRLMLPQEMREVVNLKTTFSLVSSVYDDVLKEMNSALSEMNFYAEVWDDSVQTGIMEIAKKLLLSTMKRLQDFLDICSVCGWLRASRGSPVDIHRDLKVVVPPLSIKVVEAIFQAMLSISSEGTSVDCMDTSLSSFLQDVADQVKTKVFPWSATPRQLSSPSDCSVVKDLPSPQEQADLATEEHLVDKKAKFAERLFAPDFLSEASKMVYKIINDETSETATTTEGDKSQQTSLEPPVFESELENSMLAAASGLVSALVTELMSTLEEDFELVDPSADPSLYSTQVEIVSDKVLNSIQDKVKDILVADLFMRANGALNAQDDAQLNAKLLSASSDILKTITDSITEVLQRLARKPSTMLYYLFLRALKEGLNLTSQHLSKFCKARSDQSKRRRVFPVRSPKFKLPKLLRFK
ncbi:hypothetical protein NFI96_018762, partial [Prochilodus magdalenae]